MRAISPSKLSQTYIFFDTFSSRFPIIKPLCFIAFGSHFLNKSKLILCRFFTRFLHFDPIAAEAFSHSGYKKIRNPRSKSHTEKPVIQSETTFTFVCYVDNGYFHVPHPLDESLLGCVLVYRLHL